MKFFNKPEFEAAVILITAITTGVIIFILLTYLLL